MTTTTFSRTVAGAALAACLSVAAPPSAEAAFTFVLNIESTKSVRVTGSGSLDLTGLTFLEHSGTDLSLVNCEDGIMYQSNSSIVPDGLFDVYTGITGPANFGFTDTDPIYSTDSSGDNVGLGGVGRLHVPSGYVSGTPLNAMILLNKPLLAIGKPGSYVYSWAGDTFTVIVPHPGPLLPPVPEPATALLFGAGLLGLVAVRRRSA